jgi:ribosomal protein L37AE/L43A
MTQRASTSANSGHGEFSMTLRVTVPTSYIHERYLGRPSCPKCGELLMAPECSECLDRSDVRHVWMCDKCAYGFETLIRFTAVEKEVRSSLRLVSREQLGH